MLAHLFLGSHTNFEIKHEVFEYILQLRVVKVMLIEQFRDHCGRFFVFKALVDSVQFFFDHVARKLVVLRKINNSVRNNTYLLKLKSLLFGSWEPLKNPAFVFFLALANFIAHELDDFIVVNEVAFLHVLLDGNSKLST
jgi:hypothetical protein